MVAVDEGGDLDVRVDEAALLYHPLAELLDFGLFSIVHKASNIICSSDVINLNGNLVVNKMFQYLHNTTI